MSVETEFFDVRVDTRSVGLGCSVAGGTDTNEGERVVVGRVGRVVVVDVRVWVRVRVWCGVVMWGGWWWCC